MAEHQGSPCLKVAWLVLAVALAAALAPAAVRAAEASPFMRITAWQLDKLQGTEFSTHPIVKKGDDYYLVRRMQAGEIFEHRVQAYCDAVGLDAEKCKAVAASAQELHNIAHWYKNWQVNDRIYFLVPREVYQAKSPGK